MGISRAEKGLEIAKANSLQSVRLWLVPSGQDDRKRYAVTMGETGVKCTCPDYQFRKRRCKHIWAVMITQDFEQEEERVVVKG